MKPVDLLNFAAALVSVGGVIISLVQRLRSEPRALLFATRSVVLLGKEAPSLRGFEATCEGTPIDSLVGTKVAVWNGGSHQIEGDDLDNLQILFDSDDEILQAELQFPETPAAGISIDPRRRAISVTIDRLAPGEGGVVNLWHRRCSSKPELRGTLADGRIGTFHPPHWRSGAGMSILGLAVLFALADLRQVIDVSPLASVSVLLAMAALGIHVVFGGRAVWSTNVDSDLVATFEGGFIHHGQPSVEPSTAPEE